MPEPKRALTASTTRLTVWKLGWRTLRTTSWRSAKSLGISRSMLAPLAIRPVLALLMATLEPLCPWALTPPTTRLPWAMA
ncbi:hypothetical protein D9M69_423830 [compost metagenome]